jgi:hypothetical protein
MALPARTDLLPSCAAIWSASKGMGVSRAKCCRSASRPSARNSRMVVCREVICMKQSKAERPAKYVGLATLYVAGILARMQGTVLWWLRGRDLFAPALARVGLHPDRVIFCETWEDRDVLPAMEEGLKCGGPRGRSRRDVSRLSLLAE